MPRELIGVRVERREPTAPTGLGGSSFVSGTYRGQRFERVRLSGREAAPHAQLDALSEAERSHVEALMAAALERAHEKRNRRRQRAQQFRLGMQGLYFHGLRAGDHLRPAQAPIVPRQTQRPASARSPRRNVRSSRAKARAPASSKEPEPPLDFSDACLSPAQSGPVCVPVHALDASPSLTPRAPVGRGRGVEVAGR
jgi:hypothetical protein